MLSLFKQNSRRFALMCMIAASPLAATITTPSTLHAHDTASPPFHASQATGERHDWCVWTESNTCNYQVADESDTLESSTKELNQSVALDSPGVLPPTTPRTASSIESLMAAVAATACARSGVSVQQIVEPFVMVGHEAGSTTEQIAAFTRWWAQAHQQLKQQSLLATAADTVANDVIQGDVVDLDTVSLVPLAFFGGKRSSHNAWSPLLASVPTFDRQFPLDQNSEPFFVFSSDSVEQPSSTTASELQPRERLSKVAMEKPIDAEADSLRLLGKSILVTQSNLPASPASKTATSDALVGSSAMIVTIDEVYMPYDLAARDVQVSKLFPMARRPFCVLSRRELPGLPDSNGDQIAVDSTKVDAESIEQFRTLANQFVGSTARLRHALRPNRWAEQLAALMVEQNTLALRLANLLPTEPAVAQPNPAAKPATAGTKLLARAELHADNGVDNGVDADLMLDTWIRNTESVSASLTSAVAKLFGKQDSIAKVIKKAPGDSGNSSRR